MTLADLAEKRRALDAGMLAIGAWEALLCDVGIHLDGLRERVSELQDEYVAAACEFARDEERAA